MLARLFQNHVLANLTFVLVLTMGFLCYNLLPRQQDPSINFNWIDITTVHKGGLFGTDYRMLFPGDGIDGIKPFLLDVLVAFGKRGLA